MRVAALNLASGRGADGRPLGRAALRILVQAAPEHLQVTAVHDRLVAVPGVAEVHDLHVWTVTSGLDAMSGHLVVADPTDGTRVLRAARAVLEERFGIEHTTIQVEDAALRAAEPDSRV